MAKKSQEGMDILKFFIGVMTLLTIFVAGFAAYNWSQVGALADQVVEEQADYESIRTLGRSQAFKDLIAKEREVGGLVGERDPSKLDKFLQDMGSNLSIGTPRLDKLGAPGGTPIGNFLELSFKLTWDQVTLEQLTEYLYQIQLEWPGLTVKDITLKEKLAKGSAGAEGEWLGFNVQVSISTFRSKSEAGQ